MPLPPWLLTKDTPGAAVLLKKDGRVTLTSMDHAVKNLPPKEERPKVVRVMQAYVKSGLRTEDTYNNRFNDQPYYVIVGRGFTGTLNHATLLKSKWSEEVRKARAGAKITHVGYPDPWTAYIKHEMNQEREILTHPGFLNHLPVPHDLRDPKKPFVWSDDFAKATSDEMNEIAKQDSHETLWLREEVVDDIDPFNDSTGDRFDLKTDRAKPIKAVRIDFCTGPGQSRIAKIDLSDDLRKVYEDPPYAMNNYEKTPRIIAGSQYTQNNVRSPESGCILVSGAGPAAAQATEHVLGLDVAAPLDNGPIHVLWSASEKVNRAFIPNGRVDGLAKTAAGLAGGPLKWPRMMDLTENLWPTSTRLVFGEGYTPKSAKTIGDTEIEQLEKLEYTKLGGAAINWNALKGRILVSFEAGDKSRLVDCDSALTEPLVHGVFDQLILASGLQASVIEPGSAMFILAEMQRDHNTQFKTIQRTSYGPLPGGGSRLSCPLGIQSEDSKIRVLGAAGASSDMLPILAGESEFAKLTLYQESLPAQARVFYQGVTLNAILIAHANGLFDSIRNSNVNTASRAELISLLGSDLSDAVYYMRNLRVRPFTSMEVLRGAIGFYRKRAKEVYDGFLKTLPKKSLDKDFETIADLVNDDEELKKYAGECPESEVASVKVSYTALPYGTLH